MTDTILRGIILVQTLGFGAAFVLHLLKKRKSGTCKNGFTERIQFLKAEWPYQSHRYKHGNITDNVNQPAIIHIK